jgi:hypothetical protein
MRDPQKKAFKSAFQKTQKIEVSELLALCQCQTSSNLEQFLVKWRLNNYYEIDGAYCIRNSTPTKWEKFKSSVAEGGKFLVSKAIPVAIGIATGGAGLGVALASLVPDIINKLQQRGLKIPDEIGKEIKNVIQAKSPEALDYLVEKITEANEESETEESVSGKTDDELSTLIKLSVNEELLPYITEIKKSLSALSQDQGHLTEILEGWMEEQEQILVNLQVNQSANSKVINDTNYLLNNLADRVIPQLSSIDERLDGIQTDVKIINVQLSNFEQQLMQVFETVCQNRFEDLSWDELLQVSRIQFQSIRLCGKWDEPYDPDLFLETPALTSAFNGFLTQRGFSRPLFIMLANMGMGKTWNTVFLGHYARDIMNGAIPFFIPIHLGYEELLGEVFGTLGMQLINSIGHKAESVYQRFGKKVLLLFDGLDEYPIADRQPFLNFLQQLLVQYGRVLWVVLSDRITDWIQHPQLQAFHPRIQEWIYALPECESIRNQLNIPTPFSGYLSGFSDLELNRAISKYKFDPAQIPATLYRLAHRPYILRLMLKWGAFPNPDDINNFAPYFYNPREPTNTVLGRMGIVRPVDSYFFKLIEIFGSATATKNDSELASYTNSGSNPSWFALLSCGMVQEEQVMFSRNYSFDPTFHKIINQYLQSKGINQSIAPADNNEGVLQPNSINSQPIQPISEGENQNNSLQNYHGNPINQQEYTFLLELEQNINQVIPKIPNFEVFGFGYIEKDQHLIGLKLDNLHITTIPKTIQNCSFLEQIDLSNNFLTILPPEIYQLNALISLNLHKNNIIQISPEIQKMKNLLEIDLSDNFLLTLPNELNILGYLKNVKISDNLIEKIPNFCLNSAIYQECDEVNKLNFITRKEVNK